MSILCVPTLFLHLGSTMKHTNIPNEFKVLKRYFLFTYSVFTHGKYHETHMDLPYKFKVLKRYVLLTYSLFTRGKYHETHKLTTSRYSKGHFCVPMLFLHMVSTIKHTNLTHKFKVLKRYFL